MSLNEAERKKNLEYVREMLLNKSSYITELKKKFDHIDISNGGDFYSIWFDTGFSKARFGEAKIDGDELVLYKDRYGNDHEIEQFEIERISMT